jgi:small-conductance mechanosensitive channel
METDKTINAPPPRSICNVHVSYSAITQKNTGPKMVATASTAPETEESSTSSISNTSVNEDDNGMQQLKRKLAKIDLERSQFKTQQQKVKDDVSTLTQSMNKMGGAASSTFAKIWLN